MIADGSGTKVFTIDAEMVTNAPKKLGWDINRTVATDAYTKAMIS